MANQVERFQFDGKELFGHTCEIEQIFNENRYAPQNEPNTAQLSFSGVLKRFCLKLTKTSLLSKKWLSHKETKNYSKCCCFFYDYEKW